MCTCILSSPCCLWCSQFTFFSLQKMPLARQKKQCAGNTGVYIDWCRITISQSQVLFGQFYIPSLVSDCCRGDILVVARHCTPGGSFFVGVCDQSEQPATRCIQDRSQVQRNTLYDIFYSLFTIGINISLFIIGEETSSQWK